METTQSECCYAVSPVLHIITCCFTADGLLSKKCRGGGKRAEGRAREEEVGVGSSRPSLVFQVN